MATTLVQPDGLLIQGGWYPVIRYVYRSTDEALLTEIVDWRGGEGEMPPIGFVTAAGDLTFNPDNAFPLNVMVNILASSSSIKGDRIATQSYPEDAPQNTDNMYNFVNVASGYVDEDATADTNAYLRIPYQPDPDQLGFVFEYDRDGDIRQLNILWGEYGTHDFVVFVGETIAVKLVEEQDGEQPYFETYVKTGPLEEAGTLTIYKMGSGGLARAELDRVNAQLLALQNEYNTLAMRQPTTGGTTVVTTDITGLSFVESTRTLTITYIRDGNTGTRDVIIPGQALTNFHEFELVKSQTELAAVATDGTETVLVTTAFGTYVAGDILTYSNSMWNVAINLVQALVIPDGSIAEVKLSAALLAKLNSKITLSNIDPAAGVLGINNNQKDSFRRRIEAAGDDLTYHNDAFGYHLRQGNQAGKLFATGMYYQPGDESLFVSAAGLTGSATINLPQLAAKTRAVGGENILFTPADDHIDFTIESRQYYIGLDSANQYLIGSGTVADDRVMSATVIGSYLDPAANVRNATTRWRKPKLPSDTVYTDTERFSSADERKLDALGEGNSLVSGTFIPADAQNNAKLADRRPGQQGHGTWGADTGDEGKRLLYLNADGDGSLTLWFAGTDTADYATDTFVVNNHRVPLAHATRSSNSPGIADTVEFEFETGDYRSWITDGSNTWAVEGKQISGVNVEDHGTALGNAEILDIEGSLTASKSNSKVTLSAPQPTAPPDPPLFPAKLKFVSNKEGRIQVESHEVIRQQDLEVSFPALRTRAYIPANPLDADGSTQGSTGVEVFFAGHLYGRLTYYPITDRTHANRGTMIFTPRGEYGNNFNANMLVIATAEDGSNRETLALTSIGHNQWRSAPLSSNNRIPVSGNSTARWINFLNASSNFAFVNPDDAVPSYLSLSNFAKELQLRSVPNVESWARPGSGWTNSTTYTYGTTPIPPRVNAGLDDELWLRIGFTGGPGFTIHGSHGVGVYSPWVKCQYLKLFTRLASPYNTGGENPYPRYPGDTDTDATLAINALKAVAHNRMELTARVGSGGYLRFHASDNWSRLGSILVQTSYLPLP